ncbi:MAG TPA: glycosyltransferase family 2 protein [Candidatus Eremiobacteraceae bacterium]|nr:glycosyltransferase family 2 protein [Candidatus Eremiobacteraceae bacterium]
MRALAEEAAITTVVPTFRRPQLLRRAMRSVLGQSYPNFRLCVYDNASGDETESVVAHTSGGDPRVTYFRQPQNVGGIENFLFGMRRVTTPYFSFLSDDDVLLPNFYETALAGFASEPRALMSVASTVEVDAAGLLRYVPLARWSRDGAYDPPAGAFAMLDNKHPTWTTILFRRDAIDAVGELDAGVGAPADLDYELRVAARFPIVTSFVVCGAYVSHAASSSTAETAAIVAGYDRIARKIGGDQNIDSAARRRLSERLERQGALKLGEVTVKSLVRGDDAAALDAARALASRPGWRLAGWSALALHAAVTRAGVLRSLLRWAEARRLRMRAKASDSPAVGASLGQIAEALRL